MSESEETLIQLQNKFQKLQLENKQLRMKARSINVLANQLEAKEEENKQLKEHILELQSSNDCNSSDEEQLIDLGVSSSGGSESPCRGSPSVEDDIPQDNCREGWKQGQVGATILVHHIVSLVSYFHRIGHENDLMFKEVEILRDFLSKQDTEERSGQAAADLAQLQAKIEKFKKAIHARKSFIDLLSDEKNSVDSKITDAISDKDVFLSQFEKDLNRNKELLKKIKLELNMDEEREELGVISDSSVSLVSSTQEGTEEAYVMVPNSKEGSSKEGSAELAELLQARTLDVKDASPMQSLVEEIPTPSISSGYVLVQKLQEQVNTISKEKEELLNVNHQWDVQYRQVEREKNQEIEALRQELIRTRKDLDSIYINENEKRREYERMWAEIRDQLENEKQAKEMCIQQKEQLQARYDTEKLRSEQLEGNIAQLRQMAMQWTPLPSLNIENLPQENLTLNAYQHRSPVAPPSATLPSAPSLPISRPPAAGASIPAPPPAEVPASGTAQGKETLAKGVTVEDIEMLKQQINVYADDFRTERADRERIQAEKEQMKEELNELKERFTALQQQVKMYEEDFKREHMEKTRLLRQLQALQGISPPPPEYATEQRFTAEQIRAEERRLQEMKESFYAGGYPRYNPAYSRGGIQYSDTRPLYYARGPRENVETRGRLRGRDDMFHGGDVVPDSELDVKDMAA